MGDLKELERLASDLFDEHNEKGGGEVGQLDEDETRLGTKTRTNHRDRRKRDEKEGLFRKRGRGEEA